MHLIGMICASIELHSFHASSQLPCRCKPGAHTYAALTAQGVDLLAECAELLLKGQVDAVVYDSHIMRGLQALSAELQQYTIGVFG